ncbi:MAG: peptidoglycan bridge formation glycyltransferase FemA/FemB family protein [bacterium]
MDAKEIFDQPSWDGFLDAQPESQFLQSWRWGEFQRAVGRPAYRLGVLHEGRIVAAAQGILQNHGLGIRSFSVFRGPVLSAALPVESYTHAFESLLELIEACARERGATYLHLEPACDRRTPEATLIGDRPGWNATATNQPATSLLLNLHPPLEELLMVMHEKTRYNIRLAERKGVIVEWSSDPRDVRAFLALLHQTARRDGITVHPDAYFQTMASVLAPSKFLSIVLARHGEKVLAANLVCRFGDTVTYLHGASSDEQRNLMAPHLLQWKQIEFAKTSGIMWYDFWGIAPHDADERHPWAGITRFKRGFGGEYRSYLPAMEKPLQKIRFSLIRVRRRLRK